MNEYNYYIKLMYLYNEANKRSSTKEQEQLYNLARNSTFPAMTLVERIEEPVGINTLRLAISGCLSYRVEWDGREEGFDPLMYKPAPFTLIELLSADSKYLIKKFGYLRHSLTAEALNSLKHYLLTGNSDLGTHWSNYAPNYTFTY